jgi:hypothetical protein
MLAVTDATFGRLLSFFSCLDDQLTPTSDDPPRTVKPGGFLRLRRVRLGAVIAVAVAAGIIAWAVAGRDSSSKSSAPSVVPIGPVAVSGSGLGTLARAVRQPIYWAGPRKGYLYELRRAADGSVYIRYLPPGVKAGASGAAYLTIATYPFAGAFNALKNVTDARHVSIPGGGIALIGSKYKKSIHLAFPNVDYQVEVFHPSPGRALEVASSGQVRPVAGVTG